jgi:hypothetical protein
MPAFASTENKLAQNTASGKLEGRLKLGLETTIAGFHEVILICFLGFAA